MFLLGSVMPSLTNQTTGQFQSQSLKTGQGDYPLKSLACCSAPTSTWNTGGGSGPTTVGNCFSVTGTGSLTRLDFYLSNPGHMVAGQVVGQLYSTTGTVANGHCASQATFITNSTNSISAITLPTDNPVTTNDLQEFTFTQAITAGNYIVAFRISATQAPNQLLYSGANLPADTSIAEVDNSGTNPRGNLNQAGNDGDQTTCAGINFCIAFAAFSTIPTGTVPNQNMTGSPGLAPASELLPLSIGLIGVGFGLVYLRKEDLGGI